MIKLVFTQRPLEKTTKMPWKNQEKTCNNRKMPWKPRNTKMHVKPLIFETLKVYTNADALSKFTVGPVELLNWEIFILTFWQLIISITEPCQNLIVFKIVIPRWIVPHSLRQSDISQYQKYDNTLCMSLKIFT